VSDDLTLVLLDLLADLLKEGDAVAGRIPIPKKNYIILYKRTDSISTVPTEYVNFHNRILCVDHFF
jgi:hypothetical protein